MTTEKVADTYISFDTPFGKISVEPGDQYNVSEENKLEEVSRRTYKGGIYTTALLEVQVAHSDTGWVDPGEEIPA